MITCRWAPKPLVTPLATRLSAALRKMFVFFVFIYYTVEIQSTYKYNGWHICLPFTQTMASAAWRLKSNWGSRPQSLGAFGNCRAIILWPLASVFGELGGKLGHDKKMKRYVNRQFITVEAWDVTYKALHKASD